MSGEFSISGTRPRTDLPVLLPVKSRRNDPFGFSRWMAGLPAGIWMVLVFFVVAWPVAVQAQTAYPVEKVLGILFKWMPLLLFKGFLLNIVISFLTMFFGTIAGLVVGLGRVSRSAAIRRASWIVVQLFRNSPWLVLLFIVMLTIPFEVSIGGVDVPVPDWIKAVIGLSLPVMANIAEIVRGAVRSVPSGQWEAAESLAFSRTRIMWEIILPQCIKRMIPPWMNWYAIMTMATPLVSLLGVSEMVTLSRQAMEA
jgi:polar amino acid transport system permease protein